MTKLEIANVISALKDFSVYQLHVLAKQIPESGLGHDDATHLHSLIDKLTYVQKVI